ncbi:carbohydrate ABC transporter permease [Aggregatilinea lenta]|uniref:carbohydrate ABC transporter permease n=1 Tax=Aggregatilinea lenta TaxID=913108 RepID=UPI0013C37B33|nr:sugar ABC transporter permease [Aggregatilinea lenta]
MTYGKLTNYDTTSMHGSNRAVARPPDPRENRLKAHFRKARREIARSNKWAYVFIAPLLIDFIVFTVYMIGRVLAMSFQDVNYGTSTWVGLKHYDFILHDAQFWNAMQNTLVYTLATVPLGILLALALSELIYRRSTRIQVFYKSAYYLPSVVSTVVLSIVWMWIYQPFNGILNYFGELLGAAPVNWLGNPSYALGAIIVMSVLGGVGVSVVFITAAMGGIPHTLYDAARIDGAGEWVRFWRVTVPLLRPTLLYLSVVGFIGNFQVFEQIYVMTQGGPGYPGATETVGYLIYSAAFTSMNLGRAAAESVVLFLAILIFSVLQFRMFASETEF